VDFVEDLAERLAEGFVEVFMEVFVKVGEGEAIGCGEAEEVLERKVMSLRIMGRSVLPAGILMRLFGFSTLRFGSWISFV